MTQTHADSAERKYPGELPLAAAQRLLSEEEKHSLVNGRIISESVSIVTIGFDTADAQDGPQVILSLIRARSGDWLLSTITSCGSVPRP